MLDDAKQTWEVRAKRTTKNSVFLDLFQDKKNLLKLYQTILYGMTEQTVKETIRICKDRNILKEYLISREKEVVTIMMSLFDDEQIMKTYLRDAENTATYKADRATAERMIKMGKLSLEEISLYVPSISFDELKELEAEIMQLA